MTDLTLTPQKSILTAIPKDTLNIIKSFNVEAETRRPLRLTISPVIHENTTGIEIEKYKDGFKIRHIFLKYPNNFRKYPYDESLIATDNINTEEFCPVIFLNSIDLLVKFIVIKFDKNLHDEKRLILSFEDILASNCIIEDPTNVMDITRQMANFLGNIYTTNN